jgi:hypothetical protein
MLGVFYQPWEAFHRGKVRFLTTRFCGWDAYFRTCFDGRKRVILEKLEA